MTVFNGVVDDDGVFHHKAIQDDPCVALHYPDCIDCRCECQTYGDEQTQDQDRDTGLDIAVTTLVLQHSTTYFQYFSDNPDRVTETVTGILNTPKPRT